MLEGPKKFNSGKVRWIDICHWVVDYFVIIWAGHIFFGSITLDIKEPTGMRMSFPHISLVCLRGVLGPVRDK